MLPTIGPKRRSDHIDLVLALRCDQDVGIHRAAVEQVGPRQQITGGSVVCDRRPHHPIRRGRRCREHLRDQIGLLRFTGLRDVLPGMNAGASPYAVPSPIEGSGTA